MGNERILVYANSLREHMFQHLNLKLNDEKNGHGTIVANHSIHYKNEGFLGGRSFMPKGLIDNYTDKQTADLLAYIKSLK